MTDYSQRQCRKQRLEKRTCPQIRRELRVETVGWLKLQNATRALLQNPPHPPICYVSSIRENYKFDVGSLYAANQCWDGAVLFKHACRSTNHDFIGGAAHAMQLGKHVKRMSMIASSHLHGSSEQDPKFAGTKEIRIILHSY